MLASTVASVTAELQAPPSAAEPAAKLPSLSAVQLAGFPAAQLAAVEPADWWSVCLFVSRSCGRVERTAISGGRTAAFVPAGHPVHSAFQPARTAPRAAQLLRVTSLAGGDNGAAAAFVARRKCPLISTVAQVYCYRDKTGRRAQTAPERRTTNSKRFCH